MAFCSWLPVPIIRCHGKGREVAGAREPAEHPVEAEHPASSMEYCPLPHTTRNPKLEIIHDNRMLFETR
jgi:hypothetical protein